MAISDKLGIVLAGTATIGVGGTGIWMVMSAYSPSWVPISSEDENSKQEYNSGYAKDYLPYLVSAKKSENDGWWEWSLNNRYIKDEAKQTKGGFKSVSSEDKGKTLKEACLNAYKAATTNVKKGAETPTEDGHFLEKDIWKYCSPGGATIKTIKDNTSETYTVSNAYGGEENADKLVSVKDKDNDWFWEIKETSFFRSESNPSAITGDSSKSVFKDLYDQFKNKGRDNMMVRKKCEESYSKISSTDGYPEADVFKFCSIKGSK